MYSKWRIYPVEVRSECIVRRMMQADDDRNEWPADARTRAGQGRGTLAVVKASGIALIHKYACGNDKSNIDTGSE